jgi:predicted nucleic acid-binding protein
VKGVTYDTGALLAAERNDRRMWALHAGFLAEEVAPTVPAPVLAQAWRGGAKQASLSRLLALCVVEPMIEEQARAVGRLASRTRHEDVVDLAVVEGALRRQDAIVTSDPKDIQRIAGGASEHVRIEAV